MLESGVVTMPKINIPRSPMEFRRYLYSQYAQESGSTRKGEGELRVRDANTAASSSGRA